MLLGHSYICSFLYGYITVEKLERKMLVFNYLARLFLDLSSLRRSKYKVLIKKREIKCQELPVPGAWRTNQKGLNQESLNAQYGIVRR